MAALALALALAGCTMSADTKVAEDAVPKFHEMLDAGQFDAIYDGASDEFKRAATKQDFVALLAAVHRKLGASRSSSEKGWNVNYHTSGSFVTLNYATTYAQGEAHEQFVYRLESGQALLVGYNINSNALILN
jgi:hypothetical protein